jgi:regulator of protease activity HflC (stomatin/prohibitin superfamily)
MAERDPDEVIGPTDAAADGLPVEGPRREASARFDVRGARSSQAELRQALDPANQSLAEALRLSYRVLQLGILALIVTFLFSGFQSVREGFTGVKTMFGAIVGPPGEEQLGPGLHPFWPYPVGELVVFEQTRTIRLDRVFQPRERPNQTTREQQVEGGADVRELIAGRDGFVLTADGDIAHLALTAEYSVSDAKIYLETSDPARTDALVRSALMRGAVLAASRFTLREFLEQRDAPAAELRDRAQEILDRIDSGIALGTVSFVDRAPPRFVESRFREVQAKREGAKLIVEEARQEVASILTGVAGGAAFGDLVGLIQEYEAALLRDDLDAADALLTRIGERFESDDIGGEVARIVQQARASRSTLEARLAKDLRRIEGLAPAFRDNPRQLTRQLWLEAIQSVFSGPEVEIISTPMTLATFDLRFASSQAVMQARRTADLNRRKAEADAQNLLFADYQFSSEQIHIGRPGLRLERDASRGQGR